ncbi:MAG: hypothetical protein GY754_03435 [bacterium]|nr:hypothetical protein [bacterium]
MLSENNVAKGILYNILVALVVLIPLLLIVGWRYSESNNNDDAMTAIVILIGVIPLSMSISGVINGIRFSLMSYTRAAATNWIIAAITFVLGGWCTLPMFFMV